VARVRRNPAFASWFTAQVGAQVRKVTEDVADEARARCPVDSGDLVDTIRTAYPGKLRGVVIVGGDGTLATGVDYWPYVEYGTPPHLIESTGPWSLRSDAGVYFGRRVWHPGTQAQPFMRPALLKRRRLGKITSVRVLR
jgi:HK97 gp10 family phage protein